MNPEKQNAAQRQFRHAPHSNTQMIKIAKYLVLFELWSTTSCESRGQAGVFNHPMQHQGIQRWWLQARQDGKLRGTISIATSSMRSSNHQSRQRNDPIMHAVRQLMGPFGKLGSTPAYSFHQATADPAPGRGSSQSTPAAISGP